MRLVSIDLETTGLNPDTCEIIEFAAVLDNGCGDPIHRLPTFRFRVKKPLYAGEPYALSMHSELLKDIANASVDTAPGDDRVGRPHELGWAFSRWLTRQEVPTHNFNAVGKNFANFDARFLNRMESGRGSFQWNHRVLDPASMYALRDSRDTAVPSTKECVRRACRSKAFRDEYSLLEGQTHCAVYDANVVIALAREGFRGHWRKQC